MANQNIKDSIKSYREGIRILQEAIEKLQNECTHEKTIEGLYSWRIGCIEPAIMCEDCGKLISFKKDDENTLNQVFTNKK